MEGPNVGFALCLVKENSLLKRAVHSTTRIKFWLDQTTERRPLLDKFCYRRSLDRICVQFCCIEEAVHSFQLLFSWSYTTDDAETPSHTAQTHSKEIISKIQEQERGRGIDSQQTKARKEAREKGNIQPAAAALHPGANQPQTASIDLTHIRLNMYHTNITNCGAGWWL